LFRCAAVVEGKNGRGGGDMCPAMGNYTKNEKKGVDRTVPIELTGVGRQEKEKGDKKPKRLFAPPLQKS